jgi:hypothetical protein
VRAAIVLRIVSIADECKQYSAKRVLTVLTLLSITVGNRKVWANSLVLTIDKDPKAELAFRDLEVRGDSLLEQSIRLGLEHAERWQLGGGQVLVIERSQVETLMLAIDVVCNDLACQYQRFRITTYLRGKEQVLLVLLATLGLQLLTLGIKSSLCGKSARSHEA